MKWRMERMCDNCPFAKTGDGAHLRRTLREDRWKEITDNLRRDGHFLCHKTTRETGNGSKLVCAGAIEWQEKRNLPSQYVRICERIGSDQEESMTNVGVFKREVREAQAYVKYTQEQLNDARAELAQRKKALSLAESAGANGKKLLKMKKFPAGSRARYKLFNEFLRHDGVNSHYVYRDRRRNGDLSIKVNSGYHRAIRPILRKLADEVTRNLGYDGYNGTSYRVERFVFHNIPGTSKYAPGRAK